MANVQTQHLIKKLRRITKELKEIEAEITEALERSQSTLASERYGHGKRNAKPFNGVKWDRVRSRVRGAHLYLVASTEE